MYFPNTSLECYQSTSKHGIFNVVLMVRRPSTLVVGPIRPPVQWFPWGAPASG